MCFEICTQFQCLSWGFPMSVVKLSSEGSWCRWSVLPGHNKTLEERSNQSVSLMLYLKMGGFCSTSMQEYAFHTASLGIFMVQEEHCSFWGCFSQHLFLLPFSSASPTFQCPQGTLAALGSTGNGKSSK